MHRISLLHGTFIHTYPEYPTRNSTYASTYIIRHRHRCNIRCRHRLTNAKNRLKNRPLPPPCKIAAVTVNAKNRNSTHDCASASSAAATAPPLLSPLTKETAKKRCAKEKTKSAAIAVNAKNRKKPKQSTHDCQKQKDRCDSNRRPQKTKTKNQNQKDRFDL
jgi:hypothetical protein